MPDLLGLDARTIGSKVATNFLAAALGSGLSKAYYRYRPYSAPTSMANIHRGRFGRRRRMRRKPKRKGRQFARRGRRYTNRPRRRLYKRLNKNFAGNDYRRFRDVHRSNAEINVSQGGFSGAVSTVTVQLGDFPQYVNFNSSYSEVRLVDLSYVIEPRSVITGSQDIRVASGEIPYLACRTVNPVRGTTTALDVDEVRRTPGFTFIPLARKSRTTVNARPSIMVQSTVQDGTSTTNVFRHMRMPWMPITAALNNLNLSRLEVLIPLLDAQNGDEIKFDISVYATVLFRGLKEGTVDPVVPISLGAGIPPPLERPEEDNKIPRDELK